MLAKFLYNGERTNGSSVSILKGQFHGHTVIFKGLKMTFRKKKFEKNYTTLISIKNTTNFVLTTFPYDDFFFDRALDCKNIIKIHYISMKNRR